jgi:hypothetical protein
MPPFDFQNATEADRVIARVAFAVFSDTQKFHEHFRRFGGVPVPELDHIVVTALEPATPIGSLVAIFSPFRSNRDLREEFTVHVKVEDACCFYSRHGIASTCAANGKDIPLSKTSVLSGAEM